MPTNPSFRPACRTKKDINSHRVIVSHDCVFLADDHDIGTVGDTFSFEIKVRNNTEILVHLLNFNVSL